MKGREKRTRLSQIRFWGQSWGLLRTTIWVPSLHYVTHLWGMHSPTGPAKTARVDLQYMYDNCLRRTYGVNRAVPSTMLLEELASSPLHVFWWRQTLEFWNTIVASSVCCWFPTATDSMSSFCRKITCRFSTLFWIVWISLIYDLCLSLLQAIRLVQWPKQCNPSLSCSL